MRDSEVTPRFVELEGKEFLLFLLRLDRVKFPQTALRRTERAFRVAPEIPDAGTTMRFEEKPIEVDVEPVEDAVEEEKRGASSPPPPIRKMEPPAVSVIPHKPPSPDEWRGVVRSPVTVRKQKPPKRRGVFGVLAVVLIIGGALAALHFSGLLPLSRLIKGQIRSPQTQRLAPVSDKQGDIKPFREAFRLHLEQLLAAKPKGIASVAADNNIFFHTANGLTLRFEVPTNWRTEKRGGEVAVYGKAIWAVVFVVRLAEDAEMDAVGKVIESRVKGNLRKAKVSPAFKGFLCTAKCKGDLVWIRVWVEKRWVVTVMARGSFDYADIWLKPVEGMVTVVGEKK